MEKTTDKPGGRASQGRTEVTAEKQGGAVREEDCRCKEAAHMTPRELLALMMNDLAFWKKTKKG
jgi:hypothetical protein